jgi:hypothetical protein
LTYEEVVDFPYFFYFSSIFQLNFTGFSICFIHFGQALPALATFFRYFFSVVDHEATSSRLLLRVRVGASSVSPVAVRAVAAAAASA